MKKAFSHGPIQNFYTEFAGSCDEKMKIFIYVGRRVVLGDDNLDDY